jgi:hypothetical protein
MRRLQIPARRIDCQRCAGSRVVQDGHGILPFRGDSTGAVFDAILHNDPTEAVRLNIAVPAELQRIE